MNNSALRWTITPFDSLDSTQSYLRAHSELPEGTCVVARLQSAGQGREGRHWQSEPGGLYCSFLLKPQEILPDLPWALLWAVWESLEQQTGLKLSLKMPNDILYGMQKLAGMLIDSRIQGSKPEYYLCGLGINLNQRSFPPELEQEATSLAQVTQTNWDPDRVLEQVLNCFEEKYRFLQASDFAEHLLQALETRTVRISYNGPEIAFKEYWHGRQ